MEDILGRSFRSALDIRSMIDELRARAMDIAWETHDSEYDGIYILGRTPEEHKIRVVSYDDGNFEVEVYFVRNTTTDVDKNAFVDRLENELLPALAATAVVEVR